jgi:cellulose synthase/poly-beta-1,6-N-acetylglucosamine synthase-like glycosyltransferase
MYRPATPPHFRDRLVHPILHYNGALNIQIFDYARCFYCDGPLRMANDAFCPNCGFPQGQGLEAQQQFLAHKRMLYTRRESVYERRRTARNMLFVLAAVYAVFGMLSLFIGYGDEDDISVSNKLIEVLLTTGAFAGFGIMMQYFSTMGVLAAMITYSLHGMIMYFIYGLWLFLNIWMLLKLAIGLGLLIYAFIMVSEAAAVARGLLREQIELHGA